MQINYYRKQVYGNDYVYVADDEQAKSIAKITGSKTLKPIHVEGLSELGFEFDEVVAPQSS